MLNSIKAILILMTFFYSNYLFCQSNKLVLKNDKTKKTAKLEKYDYVELYKKGGLTKGYVSDFSENSIYIRLYERDKNKMEVDTVKSRLTRKRLKQNWFVKEYTSKGNIIYRSTSIDSIKFSDIDSIRFSLIPNGATPGFEIVLLPLLALSTPLWAYDDKGKYEWQTGAILLGFSVLEWTYCIVANNRAKLRTYQFKNWRIE